MLLSSFHLIPISTATHIDLFEWSEEKRDSKIVVSKISRTGSIEQKAFSMLTDTDLPGRRRSIAHMAVCLYVCVYV